MYQSGSSLSYLHQIYICSFFTRIKTNKVEFDISMYVYLIYKLLNAILYSYRRLIFIDMLEMMWLKQPFTNIMIWLQRSSVQYFTLV